MKSRTFLALAVILVTAAGCGKNDKSGAQGQSASEQFALRSQCEQLGENLLAQGVHPPSVRAEQKSNYNVLTNRCYVELNFTPADPSSQDSQSTRYLYDGQTKEVLAFYRVERDGGGSDNTACSILDIPSLWVSDDTNCELIDAKITEVMKDNR